MRMVSQDLQNSSIGKTIIDGGLNLNHDSSLLNFFRYYEIPFPLTAMEVLLSEDYTRVTNYQSIPKITHSFYNFILEYNYCPIQDHHFNITICYAGRKNNNNDHLTSFFQHLASRSLQSSDIGRGCSACKKKLVVEDVVFFYRKETICFCSFECVAVEVLVEEITKAANKYSFPAMSNATSSTANCFTFFMDLI